MTKRLRYHKYTSHWADEFTKIQSHLQSFLAAYIIDIIHVGSTSVASLDAKPILDIDIIYTDHFDAIVSLLESHNYRYEGDKGIPERHSFQQLDSTFYEHHLYLGHQDSKSLQEHLVFKRALQNNEPIRREYMRLKR